VQMMCFFQVADRIICRLGKGDRQHRFEGIHHTILEITKIIRAERRQLEQGRMGTSYFSVLRRGCVGHSRRQAVRRTFRRLRDAPLQC